MWTAESLATHLESGIAVDFLFFWGHTPKAPDVVDASCLSKWFPRAFVHDGVTYLSAEHFMMAEKARLFGDGGTLDRILAARTPAEAKQLGREVQNTSTTVGREGGSSRSCAETSRSSPRTRT